MNVINEDIQTLEEEMILFAINKLKDLIISDVIEVINEYKKETKNIIKEATIKKKGSYKNFFIKLCKPIPDEQKIIELNMKKKIIKELNDSVKTF